MKLVDAGIDLLLNTFRPPFTYEEKVLDHGYVRFIESYGSDQAVIEDARMSTNKGFLGWDPVPGVHNGDLKLLKYLYDHKHLTPFEGSGMKIEIVAPIFVFREWHRHRTQCLAGDTKICCVTPTGTTFHRTIKEIFELKHGGVIDNAPIKHKNGKSKKGTPLFVKAIRKNQWRTRILPNCQNRLLRVYNESSKEFEIAPMHSVWESGVKTIYGLETRGGNFIKASAEHPFLTRRGWVKLKDIVIGDEIAKMGKVASHERPIPPSLRQGIGVWTSMMRSRLIKENESCYMCGEVFAASDLQLDHVIPVNENLKLALDESNLKAACIPCHRIKTDTEQPSKKDKSKRGIRWEKVDSFPVELGQEMTYDMEVEGLNHNYVANGLVVHNSYNEMSARYTPLPDFNYLPTVERCMPSVSVNKQALSASGKTPTHQEVLEWLSNLEWIYNEAQKTYARGLEIGIPKELARLPVPVARYSKMRATASLRNWIGFLTLREDPSAQLEIREYAHVVSRIIMNRFPRTFDLYINSRIK